MHWWRQLGKCSQQDRADRWWRYANLVHVMPFWDWAALPVLAACLGAACSNNGSSTGTTPPADAPTTPAKGTVDGYPFSVVGFYAFTPKNEPNEFWIELSSYYDDCSQKAFPPENGTDIGIQIPMNMLAVGRYEATGNSYLVNDTRVAMSGGAYPHDDAGSPISWSADRMGGVVWIMSVSATQIAGAFWVNAPRINTSASGTFTTTICGAGDAGIDAAADATKD